MNTDAPDQAPAKAALPKHACVIAVHAYNAGVEIHQKQAALLLLPQDLPGA
jgi:hypothetical protein